MFKLVGSPAKPADTRTLQATNNLYRIKTSSFCRFCSPPPLRPAIWARRRTAHRTPPHRTPPRRTPPHRTDTTPTRPHCRWLIIIMPLRCTTRHRSLRRSLRPCTMRHRLRSSSNRLRHRCTMPSTLCRRPHRTRIRTR